MKEQFVPYDLALKLKEKGFDADCLAGYLLNKDGITSLIGCGALRYDTDGFVNPYSEILPAPLYQQVIDWFRTEHKYSIEIYNYHESFGYIWMVKKMEGIYSSQSADAESTDKVEYEIARLESIKEALKLI